MSALSQSIDAGEKESVKTAGTLFVVATPIGNLDDISSRARTVLQEADLVAAEDTRRTRQLLAHLGIRARLVSLHEHNERQRVPRLIAQIKTGARIALVSDAGTPLVSDPGYRLVAEARLHGLAVTPVPGCCAAIAALSVAGLPSDRFHFEGFLPVHGRARQARLAELASISCTMIFYEAVHRIDKTLADMASAFGSERRVVIARELTKLHETIYQGTLAGVRQALAADPGGHKGEITVIMAGRDSQSDEAELQRVLAVLIPELPAAQAARVAARLTGVSRNDAYRAALDLAERKTDSN
jgi:16S rRNA (cytidine1402-2'-O)-methyltransferase